jgi:hypothetical protein
VDEASQWGKVVGSCPLGPAGFFTEEGRARWEAAGSPNLVHGPDIDLFAPGCLSGSRARRAALQRDPAGLEAALNARSPLTMRAVQGLLGEAVAEPEFCRALYHLCTGYVTDPLPQLAELRAQGVITDGEYESAKANALGH